MWYMLFTFLRFLATELFDKCAYLLQRFSKVKSEAGKRMYGSAYSHTVSGFHEVTRTHCLMSNLRFLTINVFSMYFWQMYCVSFCLHRSRIYTRFL